MQRWGYGCNNLYKTCHVYLEEGPWWAWLLVRIADTCIMRWKIPFLHRIPIMREGESYTAAQWYGETLDDWWHLFVTCPLFELAYTHIKTTCVPLSWEECRRIFYDKDKTRWDAMEIDPEFGVYEGKAVEQVMAMFDDGKKG